MYAIGLGLVALVALVVLELGVWLIARHRCLSHDWAAHSFKCVNCDKVISASELRRMNERPRESNFR